MISSKIDQLVSAGRVRVLAFGSSNTARYLPGMHWLDCVQLGFQHKYGAVGHFVNTGIGGNSSADLLARVETDAAVFCPHLAFLTVAGNDIHRMSGSAFEANLRELHRRFEQIGTHVIFQTYYAPDSDGSEIYQRFHAFSDIVRRVAADTGSSLVDNLKRWEPLRLERRDVYLPLMRDAMHLNERGNKVYGFDIARTLGCPLPMDYEYWAEALLVQQQMDVLAGVAGAGAGS